MFIKKINVISIMFFICVFSVNSHVLAENGEGEIKNDNGSLLREKIKRLDEDIENIITSLDKKNEMVNEKDMLLKKDLMLEIEKISYRNEMMLRYIQSERNSLSNFMWLFAILVSAIGIIIPLVGAKTLKIKRNELIKEAEHYLSEAKNIYDEVCSKSEKISEHEIKAERDSKSIEERLKGIDKDLSSMRVAERSNKDRDEDSAEIEEILNNKNATVSQKLKAEAYRLEFDNNVDGAIEKWSSVLEGEEDSSYEKNNALFHIARLYTRKGIVFSESEDNESAISFYKKSIEVLANLDDEFKLIVPQAKYLEGFSKANMARYISGYQSEELFYTGIDEMKNAVNEVEDDEVRYKFYSGLGVSVFEYVIHVIGDYNHPLLNDALDYLDMSGEMGFYNKACLYALLGNEKNARRYLELALKNNEELCKKVIDDPDLSSIRGDSWFSGLLDSYCG